MQDSPPPAKRIKLGSPPPERSRLDDDLSPGREVEEDVDDQCSICLQRLTDATLVPRCSHEFCFECLVIWTGQSRRCPLCAQGIGEYLIHNIRSKYDYTKYFLPPLRSNSPALAVAGPSSLSQSRPTRRERQWGQRERREQEVQDQLERSIERRKWVYRHHLYAKHVASNVHTRYKPFPLPAQFAASPDYVSRATSFLRRELQVWPNLDIEFLTTFTLSIMKSLDIRSESAVKLLSEFLDMDQSYVEGDPHPNAEHLAHEMYSYLRSPFRDLYVYDKMVQYDEPEDLPSRRRRQTRRDNGGINFRISSRPRQNSSHPKRPDGNHEGDWQRRACGTSYEKGRKRSRSGSHDRERVRRRSRDPSVDAHMSGEGRSESQTLASSSGPSSPTPHSHVAKGKGKATDLNRVANGLGPRSSGGGAGDATIDKSPDSAHVRGLPDLEHTVIGDSKDGNRDRAPKALTLRQSIRAHLSLHKNELLKVSRPVGKPEGAPGPDLRHGRPSLLERISGMEEAPHTQPAPASAVHPGVSASPDTVRPLQPAAAQPERPGAASNNININHTEEDIIDIDNPRLDPISNITYHTAQAECADRASRVGPRDVLERTRIRLAKMKNVMVAGIPPTAPTPPPILLDPLTSAGPAESTPPVPVVATPRNKLLERLESERKRAIGAAAGELGVEPVAENTSEDSLKAELRARNQLRARLAVAKADRHVCNLER